MMNTRNILRAAVLAAVVFSAQAHAQGIPTIEGITDAQGLVQIENMIQEIEQLKSQLSAVTGNLNVGTILNNPQLRSYLPDQWQSIYNQVANGSLPGISSATTQILQQEGLANATSAGQQAMNNTLAANKAMAMAAYNASISRLQNIEALMQQSNTTQSTAEKADIANRMAAEEAMIQNEQTRVYLMTTLQQAQEKITEQAQLSSYKNGLLGLDSNGNSVGK
jgi:type IV secretion system protein VirB5